MTGYVCIDPLANSTVDTSRAVGRLHVSTYQFARDRFMLPGDTVADIACGSGFAYGIFKGHCARYIGVDMPENIAQIQRLGRYTGPDAEYYGVDLNHQSLKLGRPLDVVISFETIEHLNDPAGFLQQLGGLLREDGLLLLSTPLNPGEQPLVFKSDHVREFSLRQVESMLRETGFRVQASYTMGVGIGSAIRLLQRARVSVYRPSFEYRRTRLSRWADRIPGLTWLYCRIVPFSFLGNTGTNMLLVARKSGGAT